MVCQVGPSHVFGVQGETFHEWMFSGLRVLFLRVKPPPSKLGGLVQRSTCWVLGFPFERRNHGVVRQPTHEDGRNRYCKDFLNSEDGAQLSSAMEPGAVVTILRNAFSASKRPF